MHLQGDNFMLHNSERAMLKRCRFKGTTREYKKIPLEIPSIKGEVNFKHKNTSLSPKKVKIPALRAPPLIKWVRTLVFIETRLCLQGAGTKVPPENFSERQ